MKIKKVILFFLLLTHYLILAQYDTMYELIGEENELFGYSISMSDNGQRIAIGSPLSNTNGIDSGKVEIFDFNGSEWIQIGNDILGEVSGDRLGYSVEISSSGNRLIVGAPNSNINIGKFKIFSFDGTDWNQDYHVEQGNSNFGKDVTISHDEKRFAITSFSSTKIYELDEVNNMLLNLGEIVPIYGTLNAALSHNGNIIAISEFEYWGVGRFSKMYSFDGNSWNIIGDHARVFQRNMGCNGGCPLNYSARISISDSDPVRVITSQRYYYGAMSFRVLEYNSNSDSWDNTDDIYYEGIDEISQWESPFMLSSSGNFFLIANTASSLLKIYKLSSGDWNLFHSIPLPEQIFDQNIYYYSFKGLDFSEDSSFIGVGLPTHDSVRIFNISSVLSVNDLDSINKDSNFKIYPNPTKGLLYLDSDFTNRISFIKIYNVYMQLIKEYKVFDNEYININNFDNGIYFMSIGLKEKAIFKKFIKE